MSMLINVAVMQKSQGLIRTLGEGSHEEFEATEQGMQSGRNGFTMKLIHRDSIESPLYPGNLTLQERFARLSHQSKMRLKAKRIQAVGANQTSVIHPDIIRSPVTFEGHFYLAAVGIGTFNEVPSSKEYFLMIDTGSDVLWTQCSGADPCYYQQEPLYPYEESATYRPLSCSESAICSQFGECYNNECQYLVKYGGGAVTQGFVARETFTFRSDGQASETVENLLFGCGLSQDGFDFLHESPEDNAIAGILGMGNGPTSLINQLGHRAHGRFSYCHQSWENGRVFNTLLQFGDDAQFHPGQEVHTIALYYHPVYEYYMVDLVDITIGGTRMNFPPDTFELRPNGARGCMVDDGSPFTFFGDHPYGIMLEEMDRLLHQFETWIYPKGIFQYCHKKPAEVGNGRVDLFGRVL